ncbi:(+)-neomenthol dehydrogenase-like [Dorcoceras hygrometricum]|uniref:(+)-neomenthol dehydrogenase-like n=1 Tax=Dorcoceras hygrometricum TaxID=472368 RepID=A0A2Z7A364_9LAMI|nr:(+)-neomenthol dehydrogenase-like [Dorcoceras hygrometricum]
MDIVIWTRARWAGPSPLLSLYNVIIIRLNHNFINTNYTQNPSTSRPSLPLSHAAAAAVFAGKLVSGQLDVENPFVLISSGLLVQPDEGVSDLVVDRIGVSTAIYREEPGS